MWPFVVGYKIVVLVKYFKHSLNSRLRYITPRHFVANQIYKPWWQYAQLVKLFNNLLNNLQVLIGKSKYRQTFNIKRTFVGNKIIDHSDVAVGDAPNTSSFSTARRDEKHLSAGIRWVFIRGVTVSISKVSVWVRTYTHVLSEAFLLHNQGHCPHLCEKSWCNHKE